MQKCQIISAMTVTYPQGQAEDRLDLFLIHAELGVWMGLKTLLK